MQQHQQFARLRAFRCRHPAQRVPPHQANDPAGLPGQCTTCRQPSRAAGLPAAVHPTGASRQPPHRHRPGPRRMRRPRCALRLQGAAAGPAFLFFCFTVCMRMRSMGCARALTSRHHPPTPAAWRLQLLLRSPQDRVHLIHVQQKGHWQGGAATSGPLSQHGSAALPLSPLGSASEGGLAIPAGPRSTPGPTHATAASAPAAGMHVPPARPGAFPAGSPAVGSPVLAQFGSGGWLGLGSSSSSGGWSLTGLHRSSHQRDSQQPQEGCSELLERCRQQLLAGSKRWALQAELARPPVTVMCQAGLELKPPPQHGRRRH